MKNRRFFNKWNISLVTESWKDIFQIWIPYFNQVTGAKYCAFQILVKLQQLNALNTPYAAWESIHLAYSLSVLAFFYLHNPKDYANKKIYLFFK